MKKTASKTKKKTPEAEAVDIVRTSIERIADALESIAESLKPRVAEPLPPVPVPPSDNGNPIVTGTGEGNRFLEVTFPDMTLREIFDASEGKAENGKPLVYNFQDTWVRSEPFFDTERTIPGRKRISLSVTELGKDWNECDAIVKKDGKRMLSMAELVWLYWKHGDTVGPVVSDRYTWLSTKTVYADLGLSGHWDSSGPVLLRDDARRSSSSLGLGFSCTDL